MQVSMWVAGPQCLSCPLGTPGVYVCARACMRVQQQRTALEAELGLDAPNPCPAVSPLSPLCPAVGEADFQGQACSWELVADWIRPRASWRPGLQGWVSADAVSEFTSGRCGAVSHRAQGGAG